VKTDFHFHTCLSKAHPFDIDFFRQSVARARLEDIGAIGITDHHDTQKFEEIYSTLDRYFRYNGHYYLADGVRFYPGIEVAVREEVHLLVSGTREDILTFYERLRPHVEPEAFPTLEEFFAFQEGMDTLKVFAHPMRLKHEIYRVPAEALARFDALDLNGKDLRRLGVEHREIIERLGREHHLPVVAGSDSHHFAMVGCVFNDFHQPFESIGDLRRLIQGGAYTAVVQPDLRERVQAAQALKRAIKNGSMEL
jgi:hypothetical protein